MPFVSGSYQSPKLEFRAISPRERGVFARRAIRKGEILTVSGGLMLPYQKVRTLPWRLRRLSFHIENGFYLVPPRGRRVAMGFYVNHSCAPNAGDRDGWYALSLFACARSGGARRSRATTGRSSSRATGATGRS